MASTKTSTKTIRIANETAEYFEGKPLNRAVECIHRLLENGKLTFDGEEIKISGDMGVHTGSKDDMAVLDEMAMCFGVSSEEMLSKVVEALENGEFTFVGGRIVAVEEPWVDAFRETCHDLCIPVDKACESAIKALRRGV